MEASAPEMKLTRGGTRDLWGSSCAVSRLVWSAFQRRSCEGSATESRRIRMSAGCSARCPRGRGEYQLALREQVDGLGHALGGGSLMVCTHRAIGSRPNGRTTIRPIVTNARTHRYQRQFRAPHQLSSVKPCPPDGHDDIVATRAGRLVRRRRVTPCLSRARWGGVRRSGSTPAVVHSYRCLTDCNDL
jgi:hypothetical protein